MGCLVSREASSRSVEAPVDNGKRNQITESRIQVERVQEKELEHVSANVEEHVNVSKEEEQKADGGQDRPRAERRKSRKVPRPTNLPNHSHGEQVAAGWPSWLTAVCGEALNGWIPRKADTFEKIDKVGNQLSNVRCSFSLIFCIIGSSCYAFLSLFFSIFPL